MMWSVEHVKIMANYCLAMDYNLKYEMFWFSKDFNVAVQG